MTRLDNLLVELLVGELRGKELPEAIGHLLREGLLYRAGCERLLLRREVERLGREGVPRCEAFEAAALRCCCSYEKARNAFYHPYRPKT